MTQPPLAITKPDGSRIYRNPRTGEEVPSVTTIIRHGFPKPKLTEWAARKSAEYAVTHWKELEPLPVREKVDRIRFAPEEIRDEAAAKGTEIHLVIDQWMKGEAHEIPRKVSSPVDQFVDFVMTKQPKFLFTEATLWSRTHQYAGTCDFIAEIDGKITLGDTKSGKGIWPEAALQLSALAGCDFLITESGEEKEVPPLEELVALHIRPRSWKMIRVTEREECLAAFLAAREVLYWSEHVAPVCLEAA